MSLEGAQAAGSVGGLLRVTLASLVETEQVGVEAVADDRTQLHPNQHPKR